MDYVFYQTTDPGYTTCIPRWLPYTVESPKRQSACKRNKVFYQEKVQHLRTSDPRKWWSTINKIYGKSNNNTLMSFVDESGNTIWYYPRRRAAWDWFLAVRMPRRHVDNFWNFGRYLHVHFLDFNKSLKRSRTDTTGSHLKDKEALAQIRWTASLSIKKETRISTGLILKLATPWKV